MVHCAVEMLYHSALKTETKQFVLTESVLSMAFYVLKDTHFKRILSPAPTVSIVDCSTTL